MPLGGPSCIALHGVVHTVELCVVPEHVHEQHAVVTHGDNPGAMANFGRCGEVTPNDRTTLDAGRWSPVDRTIKPVLIGSDLEDIPLNS